MSGSLEALKFCRSFFDYQQLLILARTVSFKDEDKTDDDEGDGNGAAEGLSLSGSSEGRQECRESCSTTTVYFDKAT